RHLLDRRAHRGDHGYGSSRRCSLGVGERGAGEDRGGGEHQEREQRGRELHGRGLSGTRPAQGPRRECTWVNTYPVRALRPNETGPGPLPRPGPVKKKAPKEDATSGCAPRLAPLHVLRELLAREPFPELAVVVQSHE